MTVIEAADARRNDAPAPVVAGKVYVVMGNDFPDCVFAKEADADEYVNTKTAVEREKQLHRVGPRIHYRHYEMEVK